MEEKVERDKQDLDQGKKWPVPMTRISSMRLTVRHNKAHQEIANDIAVKVAAADEATALKTTTILWLSILMSPCLGLVGE
jgi:hypothetical protein